MNLLLYRQSVASSEPSLNRPSVDVSTGDEYEEVMWLRESDDYYRLPTRKLVHPSFT